MTPSGEKIPADYVDEMTRREWVVAWFIRRGDRSWMRRVRWHRVAGVVAVMGMIGYTATAGAVYGFVRYVRGVEKAEFLDILLPDRWDNYRVARGDKQIEEAKKYADKGEFMEAFLYARTGVASSPANRDGRLMLFDMFGSARRPVDARQTLLEGLRYHSADPVYLTRLLTLLLQRQEDAHVIALARRYLPTLAPESQGAVLFTLAAATADFFRGSYDQAEDFLRSIPRLGSSHDGRLLAAKIEWDRGYRDLALLRFRQMAAEQPQDAEFHGELVTHLRLAGLTDEARRSSLAFQIAFPTRSEPRIELLYAYKDAGETARVTREADALLRDFPKDRSVLLSLADFASNAGDVAMVRKVANQAATQQLPIESFALRLVESQIVARDFKGAIEAIRGYQVDFPEWERRYLGLFDTLQAAALLGKGDVDAASLHLEKFLAQADIRAENLLAVANRFVELGAEDQARRALVRAAEVDPLNQAVLTRVVELDVKRNAGDDLAAHVQRLVRMRRPSPDVLRSVQVKLGGDFFLFTPECPRALEATREALARVSAGGGR